MTLDFLYNLPIGKIVLFFAFAFYWLQAFFIIYHLVRFGVGVKPKMVAIIYFLGAIILYTIISNYIQQLDLGFVSNFNSSGFGDSLFDSINPLNILGR